MTTGPVDAFGDEITVTEPIDGFPDMPASPIEIASTNALRSEQEEITERICRQAMADLKDLTSGRKRSI